MAVRLLTEFARLLEAEELLQSLGNKRREIRLSNWNVAARHTRTSNRGDYATWPSPVDAYSGSSAMRIAHVIELRRGLAVRK